MQMFIQVTVKVSPCSCQICPGISELLQWTLRDTSLIAFLKAQGHFPRSSVSKKSACNPGDPGSIPGSGRSPGEGNGNPLQYSCLDNPMTEEPSRLQCTGSQSQTWLSESTTTMDTIRTQVMVSSKGCFLQENLFTLKQYSMFVYHILIKNILTKLFTLEICNVPLVPAWSNRNSLVVREHSEPFLSRQGSLSWNEQNLFIDYIPCAVH